MPIAIAIHGGAGTVSRSRMTPSREAVFHASLRAAVLMGHARLMAGESALDAVVAAVMALEDDPLFNAGHGGVYTSAGRIEMDAAVMFGPDRRAGAVAGINGPRNPVLAARAVLTRGECVLMAGEGALTFCRKAGLVFEAPGYFETEERREALDRELARRAGEASGPRDDADRHGTVGAVALDSVGRLAAATSTGGLTGKAPGRIGDTPVFGAGTWADETCAVSCTGDGEVFIRYAAAHEIASRMRLAGQGLEQAAGGVVEELAARGGSGGLIAMDAQGRIALPFNSDGMYRASVTTDGTVSTEIYRLLGGS